MSDAFHLADSYVLFADGGAAETLEVTDQFWPDVMAGRISLDGRLITVGTVSEDWPHWEMHPKGEELVVLIRGAVELVIERDGEEMRRTLSKPGEAWLNRRGDWHRAVFIEPAMLLFVTHGEGTQHRPL